MTEVPLESKSMDWFLYDRDHRRARLNHECKKGDLNQKEVKLTICTKFPADLVAKKSLM